MKKLMLVLALVALAFASACGDSEDIVITLDWFQNANHAGIYEAVDKGFFEDEGLSVSVEPPADPSANGAARSVESECPRGVRRSGKLDASRQRLDRRGFANHPPR